METPIGNKVLPFPLRDRRSLDFTRQRSREGCRNNEASFPQMKHLHCEGELDGAFSCGGHQGHVKGCTARNTTLIGTTCSVTCIVDVTPRGFFRNVDGTRSLLVDYPDLSSLGDAAPLRNENSLTDRKMTSFHSMMRLYSLQTPACGCAVSLLSVPAIYSFNCLNSTSITNVPGV